MGFTPAAVHCHTSKCCILEEALCRMSKAVLLLLWAQGFV